MLTILGAFHQIGGLELVTTNAGTVQLEERHVLSQSAGLPSLLIDPAQAVKLSPDFVNQGEVFMGRISSLDGAADPKLINQHYLLQSKSHGAITLPLRVTSTLVLKESLNGHKFSVNTEFGFISTKKLVVAAGIWTQDVVTSLGVSLPIIPVLHPYAYGPERSPRDYQQPFVRWLERHIYARDHGNRDGWGTYDHDVIICTPKDSSSQDLIIPRYIQVFQFHLLCTPNAI